MLILIWFFLNFSLAKGVVKISRRIELQDRRSQLASAATEEGYLEMINDLDTAWPSKNAGRWWKMVSSADLSYKILGFHQI